MTDLDATVVDAGVIGRLATRELIARAPGLSVAVLGPAATGSGASRRAIGLRFSRRWDAAGDGTWPWKANGSEREARDCRPAPGRRAACSPRAIPIGRRLVGGLSARLGLTEQAVWPSMVEMVPAGAAVDVDFFQAIPQPAAIPGDRRGGDRP